MWPSVFIFTATGTAIGALIVTPTRSYPHKEYHPFDRIRMGALCGGIAGMFGIASLYLFKEVIARKT